MAITSKEINLSQLDKELGGKGLIADFSNLNNKVILPADNSDITEEELQLAINNHIAVDDLAIKIASRVALLERLGISQEEARLLFG